LQSCVVDGSVAVTNVEEPQCGGQGDNIGGVEEWGNYLRLLIKIVTDKTKL
jgi:hypothetical protein